MIERRSFAAVAASAVALLPAPVAGPGAAGAECVALVLDAVAVDAERGYELTIVVDPALASTVAARWDGAYAACIAIAAPHETVYLVDADGGLEIVEPPDEPAESLADPGGTSSGPWSDVDGIGDLVDHLHGGADPAVVAFGLPDPLRSPVTVFGWSAARVDDDLEPLGSMRVAWHLGSPITHDIEHEIEAVSPTPDGDLSTDLEIIGDAAIVDFAWPAGEPRTVPAFDVIALHADEHRFPSVTDVVATCVDGGYDFAVTMRSPYDSPERYADGWRIVDPSGAPVFGEHTLLHHHATEQPFTRTQRGVEVPPDVTTVVVEGRDLDNGYGGATFTVELPTCS